MPVTYLATGRFAVAVFDPLAYGTPLHEFWAEDPGWTNPGNGVEVLTWRNGGTNGVAATGTTGAVPTFATSGINSRPALVFDGVDNSLTIAVGDTATTAKPGTVIVVFDPDVKTANYMVIDSPDAINRWVLYAGAGDSQWHLFAQSDLDSATNTVLTTLVAVAVFSATTSKLRLNGTEVLGTGNVGSGSLDGFRIGRDQGLSSSAFQGKIAYVAVHPSDITGESWFAEYESGLRTMYGV